MTESPLAGSPVAEEVRRKILAEISSGALAAGQRLASERELAQQLGVSRATLRHALGSLAQAGILRRVPGRSGGTFVAHAKVERDLTQVDGLPAYLHRQGFSAGSRVLATALVRADEVTRAALALAEDALVHDIVRVRLADGSPISLDHARFPADLFPDLLEQPLGGSLYELFEQVYGVRPAVSEERIEVVAATPHEAQVLDVSRDAPLLSVTRVTRDESGRRFEFSHDLFRADRTRIAVSSAGRGLRANACGDGNVVELRTWG
jgi:GntR family transcriptional regulator